MGMPLFLFRNGQLTVVAEDGICFAQRGVDSNPAVEDEAFAFKVRAAAFLEIFQDAAVELMNVRVSNFFHERAGLFTANAARAEHNDRLCFELRGKFFDRRGKFAEVIDPRRDSSAKRAHPNFVVVARVE